MEKDLDVEKIVWNLFKQTGEIKYYLFYKALEHNKQLEITEPSLFRDAETVRTR